MTVQLFSKKEAQVSPVRKYKEVSTRQTLFCQLSPQTEQELHCSLREPFCFTSCLCNWNFMWFLTEAFSWKKWEVLCTFYILITTETNFFLEILCELLKWHYRVFLTCMSVIHPCFPTTPYLVGTLLFSPVCSMSGSVWPVHWGHGYAEPHLLYLLLQLTNSLHPFDCWIAWEYPRHILCLQLRKILAWIPICTDRSFSSTTEHFSGYLFEEFLCPQIPIQNRTQASRLVIT